MINEPAKGDPACHTRSTNEVKLHTNLVLTNRSRYSAFFATENQDEVKSRGVIWDGMWFFLYFVANVDQVALAYSSGTVPATANANKKKERNVT